MNTGDNCSADIIDIGTMEDENTHLEDLTQLFEENEEMRGSLRAMKRVRENDEWTQVRSRKQKQKEVRGITELCVTCKDMFPKQFALAKLFKSQDISNITRVKHVNPYKIIIELNNADSAEKLINSDHFSKLGWRFQRPFEVGLSYGTIKNIELEISEEELLSSMSCSLKVVNVRRLKRRDREGDNWIESETWRVGFEGPSLPEHVYICDMRVPIEPYVFPVTQCSRCWRYGHTLKMCPSKRVFCPKCGGRHENCETNTFRCINCANNHMSLDKSCPVYAKEKKLRELMSQFNVSYRKAMDMYVPPKPPANDTHFTTPRPTLSPATPMSPVLQSKMTYAQIVTRQSKETDYTHMETIPQSESQKEQTEEFNKKKKKKKNRQEANVDECMIDFCEDTCRGREAENEGGSKNEHSNEYSSFKWLTDKIKQIIFMRTESLKDKIILVVQISMEWAISWIFNNIIPKDFTFLKHFFNNV